jgi:protein TonB
MTSTPVPPEVFVQPGYPPLARMAKVEGSVSLRIEVDTDGAVTDSTIVSGNPLFARAVKEAVVGWKFPRDASQREVQATIEFILNCGKKGS